jgi:hypothetical protein
MISRRDFLKGAGVAALAVATTGMLAGCSVNVPGNPGAPAPSEPETPAASKTLTLAEGVTLTFTGTVREKVIPTGTLQYLAIKFKLNNETKKNVTISENNFKTNLNGKWEFPIAPNMMSDSQKQFLFEKAGAPFMGYYETMGGEPFGGGPFGAAGTDLEAAICFMTQSTESKMDLVVTYDAKVYKVALDI